MPTKVEHPYSGMNAPHHHDHATRNNAHHKEALRLALGSILAPKRPLTPMSRSSSGSATPAAHHESSHPASLAWPPLAGGDSAHPHLRSGSLPHTHSHSPSAHSANAHPQTTPPVAHPPQQTTHPNPLPFHPPHPTRFSRPDLAPSTTSPAVPQISQTQSTHPQITHPHSHPHSLPHSLPHSHTITPHPLTPPHIFAFPVPPHSNIPSGASTPPMCGDPPSTVHSPALGPSSVPEEESLQMLPPLVAAGSTSGRTSVVSSDHKSEDTGARDLALQGQAVNPRPHSHLLPTTAPALEEGPFVETSGLCGDSRLRERQGIEGTQAQRAGFIQTLQSKNSAWDALIHGSFS